VQVICPTVPRSGPDAGNPRILQTTQAANNYNLTIPFIILRNKPSHQLMTFINLPKGISDLFFHPDAFFERVSKEKVNLFPPVLIVLIGALIFVIIILLFFVWNRTGWSSWLLTVVSWSRNIILSLAGRAFIMPFLVWAVFSVIFYGLSRAASGTGSFSMTVQNTGYGMLPWSVSALIPVAAYLHHFFTFTSGPQTGGYSGIWMMPWPWGFYSLPLFLILIWSVFLWVPAVQHTHGFTRQKAAIIVGIPVFVLLILQLSCLW
jgi:hypothetical protein